MLDIRRDIQDHDILDPDLEGIGHALVIGIDTVGPGPGIPILIYPGPGPVPVPDADTAGLVMAETGPGHAADLVHATAGRVRGTGDLTVDQVIHAVEA